MSETDITISKDQQDVLAQFLSLIEQKESNLTVWKTYLQSNQFAAEMEDTAFINGFADILKQHISSFKLSLCKEIEAAYFSDNRHNPQTPPYSRLYQLIAERKPSAKKRKAVFKSIIQNHFMAVLFIFIVIAVGIFYILSGGMS